MISSIRLCPLGFNSCGNGISSGFSYTISSKLLGLNFSLFDILSNALLISVMCCCSNIVLIWLILNPFCNDLIITLYSIWSKLGETNTIYQGQNNFLIII